MMGEEITELDDMAKSAVAEMATMILGRTGIIFSEKVLRSKSAIHLVEGDCVYISTLSQKKRTIINIPDNESGECY